MPPSDAVAPLVVPDVPHGASMPEAPDIER
jgi:hypothetical protein